MGLRRDGELTLTVASPFLATRIEDATDYVETEQAAEAAIQEYASQLDHRKVMVNTADDVAHDADYLTLTGTSAEMGDDGAGGRGNRANDLITPFRSPSLEAACGKNPISHVGKVYNVLALLEAQEIVNRVDTVLVCAAHGRLTPSMRADVRSMLNENLAGVHDVRAHILNRELTLS